MSGDEGKSVPKRTAYFLHSLKTWSVQKQESIIHQKVINFISHNTEIEMQLPLWATQVASEKEIKETFCGERELKHWTHCHNMPHSHSKSCIYSLHYYTCRGSSLLIVRMNSRSWAFGHWNTYILEINIKFGSWVYKIAWEAYP